MDSIVPKKTVDASFERGQMHRIPKLASIGAHIAARAVDQDDDVMDILVQPRRDQRSAERFFRRLLRGRGKEPLRIITDKIGSY